MHKAVVCSLLSLTLFFGSSFTKHAWQHEAVGPCSSNVLENFYPDQNACNLFKSIPSPLRHLSYGIYPISKGYDTARFNFNKRFNLFPTMIVAPRTEKEIIKVLKLLKKHHLPFSIRSGGHCLEPGSLSTGYIIDLRNFDSIKPDVHKKDVYIGAGCRLGTVIETLGKLHFAIPTGTCSSVGTAGLTLGGGLGVLGRIVGLTCDSVKSIRILMADGKIVDVSPKQHEDLFWALRGAGNGSYGIVLGFTFKMHRIHKVRSLKLSWKWDHEKVPHIIKAWQDWIKTLCNKVSSQLQITYQNHELAIVVTGLKKGSGSFNEWKHHFEHLDPKVANKKETYLESTKDWADRAPFAYLKGKSTILMHPLSHEPIESIVHFFEKLKHHDEKVYCLFEFEGFGKKIEEGDSAFFPRKAFGWWYQVVYWNEPNQEDDSVEMLRKFHKDITPYVSKYAYANIVDYDLGDDYLDAYYGSHVDRLIHIKRKYDPDNLFHWRQSIPTSKSR